MSLRSYLRGIYNIYNFGIKGFRKEEKRLKQEYYQFHDNKFVLRPSVVFLIDGRSIHGGLTDRLRGICSIYTYCKQKGIPFHLHANYPFLLEDYLVPNAYDWRIDTEKITYDPRKSVPVLINDYQLNIKLHKFYLNKRLREKKQIHIYGNTPFLDDHFTESFSELFIPSNRLQQDIDNLSSSLSLDYVAITTRFQQLLGDFKETGYKTLPKEDQCALINKCVKKIEELHNTELSGKQILCTSDSITFLNEVNKLSYVSIIPGSVVHMDHTSDASFETYEKSFLDLYIIAQAEKIILLQTEDMYSSGFPKRAAMIYNKPFIHLTF